MRACRWNRNQWASHVTSKDSVSEMYDQLARKGVIKPDPRQRTMAEACGPVLAAARREAKRRADTPRISPSVFLREAADSGEDWAAENDTAFSGPSPSWLSCLSPVAAMRSSSSSLLRRLFPGLGPTAVGMAASTETIGVVEKRGIYLFGDVGIGKMMILDLFELCDVGLPKQRAHLHSFMTDISERLGRREEQLRLHREAAYGHKAEMRALAGIRPMDLVVGDILADTPVLCFDEFQTFDVAHAALLSSFFSTAFRRGLFLITTSNRSPEDLCAVSASFNRFLPSLHRYCAVLEFLQIRDYRQRPVSEHRHETVFLHPNSRANAARLLRRVEVGIQARMLPSEEVGRAEDASLVAAEPPAWITEDTLWHHGRCFVIPYHCGGVAVFDFRDICGDRLQELASSDFQILALNFHTVVVYNVPQIGTANRNAAHQFIVLVDELYQHNVKLLFTAAVPWDRLLDTAAISAGHAAIETPDTESVDNPYYRTIAAATKPSTVSTMTRRPFRSPASGAASRRWAAPRMSPRGTLSTSSTTLTFQLSCARMTSRCCVKNESAADTEKK